MRPITTTVAGLGLAGILAAPAALPTTMTDAPGNAEEAHTAATVVLINEFAPSGWSVNDEFLELHNTGDQIVSLDGWGLAACLTHDFALLLVSFGSGDVIFPGQHLLLAHVSSTAANPDYFYDFDIPDDGGWLLTASSNQSDGVALRNDTDCTEGGPAPQCDWGGGQAVTRDLNSKDTDNNAADFTCQLRTPGR